MWPILQTLENVLLIVGIEWHEENIGIQKFYFMMDCMGSPFIKHPIPYPENNLNNQFFSRALGFQFNEGCTAREPLNNVAFSAACLQVWELESKIWQSDLLGHKGCHFDLGYPVPSLFQVFLLNPVCL